EGLTVTIGAEPVRAPALGLRVVKLEMTGQDRPGIIKEIAHALATRGVSIDELESTCASASWSGEVMFKVTAELSVPAGVATEQLCAVLENLGNELMVDIAIEEEGRPTSP
ncbi:MAG: glycine cleavage system protein R, partial [Gammaproteobacteria bacterium]